MGTCAPTTVTCHPTPSPSPPGAVLSVDDSQMGWSRYAQTMAISLLSPSLTYFSPTHEAIELARAISARLARGGGPYSAGPTVSGTGEAAISAAEVEAYVLTDEVRPARLGAQGGHRSATRGGGGAKLCTLPPAGLSTRCAVLPSTAPGRWSHPLTTASPVPVPRSACCPTRALGRAAAPSHRRPPCRPAAVRRAARRSRAWPPLPSLACATIMPFSALATGQGATY